MRLTVLTPDVTTNDAAHVYGVLRWRAEDVLERHGAYDLDVIEQVA